MMEVFRRILVPHDFSDAANAALAVAADLAVRHRGTLAVVHAIPPAYPVSAFAGAGEIPVWIPPDDLRGDARARLEEEVARVVGKRVRDVTCRVVVGDPYRCILQAARRADSIVMATYGRTGLAHLVIGSVAEKVVRHSPVPVLTLRPAATRAARSRGGSPVRARKKTGAGRAGKKRRGAAR
jgi:nucleotide-binding universal stress UspA family protein